ncbi:TPA: hypothetical protein DDW35_11295 [Candidatus Sumerlaeota bacterium]|nr:hypothetical protein [Candidatus Sumerlaeota bacterium]
MNADEAMSDTCLFARFVFFFFPLQLYERSFSPNFTVLLLRGKTAFVLLEICVGLETCSLLCV